MRRTYCIAEMKFIDVTALADSVVSSEDNQDIGDVSLFKEQIDQLQYGTLEHNQFILDQSKDIVPDVPTDIGFWSKEKSLENCSFITNPVIDITFDGQHTSSGITLYFEDEYPTEIIVTWYNINGTKLISDTFYPDSLSFFCEQQVENYSRIQIEFVKTLFPCRYIKLQFVLYGHHIVWQKDIIRKAKVQEEIDETSATLSINTADIEIIDENNEFDVGNENGMWKSIQKTQEVTLTEFKDGERVPAGTFYIDDFSFSDNVAKFSLIDTIGKMDKYTFCDGEVYNKALAGPILEAVFSTAGINKYFIADEVYNTELTGHLGIMSCRAALQMICFACGAVADDSRSDTVKVFKPDRYIKHTIGMERKIYGGSKIELDDYVSGVSIKCNNYVTESDATEIYNDTLPKGITRIAFSKPYLPSSIVASKGTILVSKTNYMEIQMNDEEECIITGIRYNEVEFLYQKNVSAIEAGENENVKNYGTCTLHNATLLKDVAEHLLSYHSLRKKVDLKYLLELEQVGNWVNINSANGDTFTTLIEKQTIDLTGGFITSAICRGYSIVITEFRYTGTELYAGGNALL